MTVKFYTVAVLVMRLGEAKRAGTLERLLGEIQRKQLLILNEWGYIPVDKEGSQLLFRVIADSYESRSLIITTNLEFSKCGSVLLMTRWPPR
ncbi:ATP-binding protein [Cohnella yongneupensis]|uniref:ATP-binding protein n=1 Tax=Cohnella yongneupensis TaxID=425006 RepID=A0ABW0QWB4_9BACL